MLINLADSDVTEATRPRLPAPFYDPSGIIVGTIVHVEFDGEYTVATVQLLDGRPFSCPGCGEN